MYDRGPEVTSLFLRSPKRYGEVAMHWAMSGAASPEAEVMKADDALIFDDNRPQYPLPIVEELAEEQPIEHQLAS